VHETGATILDARIRVMAVEPRLLVGGLEQSRREKL
jgi:hypothetical protein